MKTIKIVRRRRDDEDTYKFGETAAMVRESWNVTNALQDRDRRKAARDQAGVPLRPAGAVRGV